MMIINSINQLTPVRQRAVIINYNTKYPAFLALLSVIKYAKIPILLIDSSTDDSFEFFKERQNEYLFDLCKDELRVHGLTLDKVFNETNDEQILLIDSDLEILNAEIINYMNGITNEYCSGFLVKQIRLTMFGGRYKNAIQKDRMFIPITLLRTAPVKEALSKGYSFAFKEVADNSLLTRILIKLKLKQSKYTLYDTGSHIHNYLKKKYKFKSKPLSEHEKYVMHFSGGTRDVLYPNGGEKGKFVKNMTEMVIERLKTEYQIDGI